MVYDFSNVNAITQRKPTPVGGSPNGSLTGVDIEGNIAIVGDRADNRLGPFTGAAYLFNATTGSQLAKLIASEGQAEDNFGHDVALDGDLAIVGSLKAKAFNDDRNGAVYQYDVNSGSAIRSESAKYFVPGPLAPNSGFGYSLDMAGGRIIAAAAFGPTYIWNVGSIPVPLPGSNWDHSFQNFTGIDSQFAVVGFFNPRQDPVHPPEVAALYRADTGQQGQTLVGDFPMAQEDFGIAAHVSNGVIVVGATAANGGNGAAYVFYVPEISTSSAAISAAGIIGGLWAGRLRRNHPAQ